jgi:hypothetical protein
MLGALMIDLFEDPRIPRPEVGIGSQVKNEFTALEVFLHRQGFADVCKYYFDLFSWEVIHRDTGPLQHTNRLALADKVPHQVGTNVSRTPRD